MVSECIFETEFFATKKLGFDLWSVPLSNGHVHTPPGDFIRCEYLPESPDQHALARVGDATDPERSVLPTVSTYLFLKHKADEVTDYLTVTRIDH